MSHRLRWAALATSILLAANAPRAVEPAPAARGLSLGLIADASRVPAVPASIPGSPGAPSHPFTVRVAAHWSDVERQQGIYDWSWLEPTIDALHAAGHRVVLGVSGSNALYLPDGKAPSPTEGSSLQGFTAFVRSAVRSFAGRIQVVEIGDDPSSVYEPAVYAFVLKSAALAARAEARAMGSDVAIAQGPVGAGRLDWQKRLWENDAAPYVDVLPVRVAAGSPEAARVGEIVASFLAEAALHPPAPAVWVYAVGSDGAADPFDTSRIAVGALAAAAPVALAEAPVDAGQADRVAKWLAGVHTRLGVEWAPAPAGGLEMRGVDGASRPGDRILGRFSNQQDFRTLVVYDAPLGDEKRGAQARLVLDTVDVKDPRVLDPIAGADLKTGPGEVPGVSKRALRVLIEDHPMLVAWDRVSANQPGLEMDTQDVKIESTRGLTAEEIIARYQAVQKVQDDRLDRWSGRGRIDFHFKLAQSGSTVDVAIESNYFWERAGKLEWEQTDYYINGNKVTWKNIPELPLIQPEKVITLPLDLTLDKTYLYKLDGEDEVSGRPAYVLSFDPANPDAASSLYRGRLWIDKQTFVRLKTSLIQTNLEAPVLSNEEVDQFAPIKGPDGETYWMMSRIDGQQLWTAGGRNFVVRRELTFETFQINPPKPKFEEGRRAAYTSTNQMLRDTDKGFRYLERKDDGTREEKTTVDTHQIFALAGVGRDDANGTFPLAGVNWFDYDFLKKKMQLNVFFAGAVAFVNLTQPDLFGKKIDLAVEGAGIALKGTDKVFVNGEEDRTQRVKDRIQYGSVRLGFPLGSFVKLTAVASGNFVQYWDDKDATRALAEANAANGTQLSFVRPANHTTTDMSAELEFNRRGWTVRGSWTASRRSKWEPWGLFDGATSTLVNPDYDASKKSYTTWDASAFKEWYLPKFQKIRAEVNWLDGKDLDRYSRYQFSLFGQDRLNGFAGTGVKFDTGAIARLGYAFNLFGAIRFDASVDHARVKDQSLDTTTRAFTGAGLSGNLVGPWKTVIQFSYGRALAADLPGLKGKQEFLLVVLKLF